jgi:hypothetical protein
MTNMPGPRRSKRFHPNAIAETIVPLLLAILLLLLLAVIVMVAWSLVN